MTVRTIDVRSVAPLTGWFLHVSLSIQSHCIPFVGLQSRCGRVLVSTQRFLVELFSFHDAPPFAAVDQHHLYFYYDHDSDDVSNYAIFLHLVLVSFFPSLPLNSLPPLLSSLDLLLLPSTFDPHPPSVSPLSFCLSAPISVTLHPQICISQQFPPSRQRFYPSPDFAPGTSRVVSLL